MSLIGSNVAQSVAGVPQAERAEGADRKRIQPVKARPVKRSNDEYDHHVSDVEAPDAVRNLAGNDQEQAHEDRQEHPPYMPDGSLRRAAKKRIDVQG